MKEAVIVSAARTPFGKYGGGLKSFTAPQLGGLAILEVLYDGYQDPKYRPCPLLKQYVDAGRLGRKVGRGFYEYE